MRRDERPVAVRVVGDVEEAGGGLAQFLGRRETGGGALFLIVCLKVVMAWEILIVGVCWYDV